jgi:hypothetical protein
MKPAQTELGPVPSTIENTGYRQESLIKTFGGLSPREHFPDRVILEFHLAMHQFTGND